MIETTQPNWDEEQQKTPETREEGFSLVELLVGLFLFGIASTSIGALMTTTFRSLGQEYRLASATQNARLAMSTIATELRMASTVSPYLPGINIDQINCAADLVVNDEDVSFFVVHDDETAAYGIRPLYVGYSYDSSTNEILRGEVLSSTSTSCSVPSDDPLAANVSVPIAQKIVPADYNEDGTIDPMFQISGNALTITFATEVQVQGDRVINQAFQSTILLRNH